MPTDPLAWPQLQALGSAGLVAGFLNVLAGGGSLLTLPVLLFAGLDAPVANASNRIGLVMQNSGASATFARGKRLPAKLTLWLALPALPGALLGARIALALDGRSFRLLLVAVMIVVLFIMWKGRRPLTAAPPSSPPWLVGGSFFLIGIYAGFLQAGLGFVLIAVLTRMLGLDLVRANAVKVFLVLLLQIFALAFFARNGQVHWMAGLALGSGTLLGGWAGAHWQMRIPEIWIRRIVMGLLGIFALHLLLEAFRG